MKDNDKELLLAEYERLIGLEQFRIQNFHRAQQLYFTGLTAAAGFIVFFLQNKKSEDAFIVNLIIVFAVILFLGEITFLRLIGEDIALIEISSKYQIVRDNLISKDSKLKKMFSKSLVNENSRFNKWSSISGILKRAINNATTKTTIVILNCCFASGIIFLMGKLTSIINILIAFVAFVILAFFHAFYSSYRYKQAKSWLQKGSAGWLM